MSLISSWELTPDTDIAAAALRIKRAFTDHDQTSTPDSEAEFFRGLLKQAIKLLDLSISASNSSWSWLGPDYMAPVLFACLAVVVKWLEDRLTRFLMKKYNIRLPSIYSVNNLKAFSVVLEINLSLISSDLKSFLLWFPQKVPACLFFLSYQRVL